MDIPFENVLLDLIRADQRSMTKAIKTKDKRFLLLQCYEILESGHPKSFETVRKLLEEIQTSSSTPALSKGSQDTALKLDIDFGIHLQAIQSLLDGNLKKCISILEERTLVSPTDLLAVHILYELQFLIGDFREMRECVARVAYAWKPLPSQMLGQIAFGVEECGDSRLAEVLARKAIADSQKNGIPDATSIHSLLHCMDTIGNRHDEALAFMNQTEKEWSQCETLSRHLRWHRAIFHSETVWDPIVRHIQCNSSAAASKETMEMMTDALTSMIYLYAKELRPIVAEPLEKEKQHQQNHPEKASESMVPLDVGDATACLLRIDCMCQTSSILCKSLSETPFEDIKKKIQDRWSELGQGCAELVADSTAPLIPLNASHYAFALAASGRWKDVEALKKRLEEDTWAFQYTLRGVVLPIAVAAEHFFQQRFSDCFSTIHSVHKEIQSIGGSHAQRDDIFFMTMVSLILSKQHKKARAMLSQRAVTRPSVLFQYWKCILDIQEGKTCDPSSGGGLGTV